MSVASIAAALAELEKSPALPDHVAHLQEFIAEEQRRREQFHRDFEGRRGEFINGQIYVSPPARKDEMDAAFCVMNLLGNFADSRGLGEVYGGKCLIHCQRNDYEPDACFFGREKVDKFTPQMLLFPPPDLAVEVLSPDTAEHDRKLKWYDYARHGVSEYWIVDPDDEMVEQYILPPGGSGYDLKARLAGSARLASSAVLGFDVPVRTLFDRLASSQAVQAMIGTA